MALKRISIDFHSFKIAVVAVMVNVGYGTVMGMLSYYHMFDIDRFNRQRKLCAESSMDY